MTARLAQHGADRHFLDSVHEFDDGWGFRFDPAWIARSCAAIVGDWGADWRALRCPTLLLRGRRSWATCSDDMQRMQAQHPCCQLLELDASHTVHDDALDSMASAIRHFLHANR